MRRKFKRDVTLPPFKVGVFFCLLYYKVFKNRVFNRYRKIRVLAMVGEVNDLEYQIKQMLLKAGQGTKLHLPNGKTHITKKDLSKNAEFARLVHRVNYLKSQLVRYHVYKKR